MSDTEGAYEVLSPLNTGWVVCDRTVLKAAVVGNSKLAVVGRRGTSGGRVEEVDSIGISGNRATVVKRSP